MKKNIYEYNYYILKLKTKWSCQSKHTIKYNKTQDSYIHRILYYTIKNTNGINNGTKATTLSTSFFEEWFKTPDICNM